MASPPDVAIAPSDRTVGQLVAETIQLYRSRFFPALLLGVVVAAFNQLAISRDT